MDAARDRSASSDRRRAYLDCRIAGVTEVGTHSVLFCEVLEIATALQPEGLIYFNRLYHRIGSPVQPVDEAYA